MSAPNTGHCRQYTDRTGQRIGEWVVIADSLKRTKRGKVLWITESTETGRVKHQTTCDLARMAKALGVPKP